jgi:uncharacterized membrane protein YccF (DUF307 family)
MSVTRVREDQQVPFLLRVIWFFLVGWYVALPWILVAWFLNLTIIGMPLGVWMLNRVPLVLTLRAQRGYNIAQVRDGEVVSWGYRTVDQHPFVLRALYFLLIGWWFSLAWSILAWLLSVSIVGLPLGVWMFNRLPEITTLMRQ